MTANQKLYQEALALLARADALLDGVRERHEAKLTSMLRDIDERFMSGNEIAVERAMVTAREWAAIRQYVSASLAALPAPAHPAAKSLRQMANTCEPGESVLNDAG